MTVNNELDSTSELDGIKEYLLKLINWSKFLFANWVFILFFGITGSVIGFSYAYFQKPIYTASLSFALEDEKSGGGGLAGAMGLATSLGLDLGTSAGGAFSGGNLMELMKSRNLVQKALLNPIKNGKEIISLADYFIIFNEWQKNWETREDLKSIKFKVGENRDNYNVQKDSIMGLIYDAICSPTGYLSVYQRDKKVSIIYIDVKTKNEYFSKVFAESLAQVVSAFYIDTKSRKSQINVSILQKQADSVRAELNSAITGVAVANDNTYNLNPALIVNRTPTARRQVDVQANTAILTQLVTNLEMAKVALRKETPLIQIIDTPTLPLKKIKASKLSGLINGGVLGGVFAIVFLFGKDYYRKFKYFIKNHSN